MKVALIPPMGLYRTALQTDTFMTLALPDLLDDVQYCDSILAAERADNFIIMDNGTPEGELARDSEIRSYLRRFKVSEVVLPDVMLDPNKTRVASDKFMRFGCCGNPCFMYVVHGSSMDELRAVVNTLPEYVNTIGIPRYLLNTINQTVRIDLANWIGETFANKYAIHFLGLSTSWVRELYAAARYASHVRSVDTSAPYNYTIAGYDLQKDDKQVAVRPIDYFSSDWASRIDKRLLQYNIDTLLRWAI